MSQEGGFVSFLNKFKNLLEQDCRGVNIAIYAFATAGLAVSIHKIRPVSKFSKASKVPDHFIRKHEPLRGVYAGVQHSPVRVLINHKAPIYLPLWHSSKPPLPVKLWGVEVVSMNAVNWLECVAKGHQVTLKPIARDNEDLVSTMLLHLPHAKAKSTETLDIAQKLVELGFAKASVPENIKKNTIESKLAPALLSAEAHAKNYRKGIWSDLLPPLPKYVVYWRIGTQATGDVVIFSGKKLIYLVGVTLKGLLMGVKTVVLWPFRASRKQVQAS